MTSKPKGKKFRVRRGKVAGSPVKAAASKVAASKVAAKSADNSPGEDNLFSGPQEDGFGQEPFPTAAKKLSKGQQAIEQELAAIEKEGLTGRQLRMARRVAVKNELTPDSDMDAVRLLRLKGIDPFKKSTMLELVVPDNPETENLPQPVENGKVPSTELMGAEDRASEIYRIQRDIAARRKRKSIFLFVRLLFFIFLPTFLVGMYYYSYATPLYATKSEFVIQQADAQSSSLGGLFSGTGFATSQDSITVQSYMQSRDAMLRLDNDIGFKAHFSQENIDGLTRLPADATNEAAYRLYKKMVLIGYDPTEGIIKMEVIATDPNVSEQYALALIKYAEEQVDNLTQRLRGDQMKGSIESFQNSEEKMQAAQNRVLELQENLGVIDPVTEMAALMGQITSFETQIREKGLQLQQLLDNPSPNQARVDGVKGDIRRLEALVGELRSQMTESGANNSSLARISGELRIAEIDLETRLLMMQQALQQLETARIEANRQTRYLSIGVNPVAPDEATYPRKFENTVVAFLIFCGLYLMASLTASVLREQVSG